jgi:2-polyprenyl-3-methyl-5-hydroxy-6-metoxy-1,4-benzoquinol methylase
MISEQSGFESEAAATNNTDTTYQKSEFPDKIIPQEESPLFVKELPIATEISARKETASLQSEPVINPAILSEDNNSIIPGKVKVSQLIKYQQKIINPKKPKFRDTISWAIRTRFADTYNTVQDAKAYDEIARYYFGREKLAHEIGLNFLQNISLNPEEAVICDRAAGTGIITEALVEAGFKVRASDLSEYQLQELSKKFPSVELKLEDINGIMKDVATESVDGVVQVAAARFMTPFGQETFVREAQRVLKKGGIIIWPVFPTEMSAKLRQGLDWKGTSKDISKLLQENGFGIIGDDVVIHGVFGTFSCTLLMGKKKSYPDEIVTKQKREIKLI